MTMPDLLYDAYFRKDLPTLKVLCPNSKLAEACGLHWKGDLLGAQQIYAEHPPSTLPKHLYELAVADSFLVDVKIGGLVDMPNVPRLEELQAELIVQYATFSWAFWMDHGLAWRALYKVFKLGLRLQKGGAVWMCVFLTGHMLAIRGWRRLGLSIARKAYDRAVPKNAISRFPSFFTDIPVAAFPYTCLVTGAPYDLLEACLIDGERLLQCDPYYRNIFDVSALYAAAYNGDIARAEIYSESLRSGAFGKGTRRYAVLADIVTLVPYALRGYTHLVQARVATLTQQALEVMEPLVRAQANRVLAFVALHDRRWSDARRHVKAAKKATAQLGPMHFWQEIDGAIESTAERGCSFKLTELSPLIKASQADRTADSLGSLLTELIFISMRAADEPRHWFVSEIAAAVGRHIESDEFTISICKERLSGAYPVISVAGSRVTFVGVAHARLSHARSLLSTLSPLILSLDRLRIEQVDQQQIKEAEATKRLALQVSHDIKSPLCALAMLRNAAIELTDEHKDLLALACQRIGHISGQLAEKISKQGKGENENQTRELVYLTAIAEQSVREKSFEYMHKSSVCIRFSSTCSQDTDACATLAAGELRRAISNLVNNAVEAFDDGGQVSVSVHRESGWSVLRVQDNGKGIAREILAKLGAEGATFGKLGGSGLGLFHAKQLAESAGGSLIISSEIGRGTAVTLRFPAAPSLGGVRNDIELVSSDHATVVDDDYKVARAVNG